MPDRVGGDGNETSLAPNHPPLSRNDADFEGRLRERKKRKRGKKKDYESSSSRGFSVSPVTGSVPNRNPFPGLQLFYYRHRHGEEEEEEGVRGGEVLSRPAATTLRAGGVSSLSPFFFGGLSQSVRVGCLLPIGGWWPPPLSLSLWSVGWYIHGSTSSTIGHFSTTSRT